LPNYSKQNKMFPQHLNYNHT